MAGWFVAETEGVVNWGGTVEDTGVLVVSTLSASRAQHFYFTGHGKGPRWGDFLGERFFGDIQVDHHGAGNTPW